MLRTCIIDAQKALYRNGSLVSLGVPRGLGMAHCPIVDRGELWEQRALKVADVIPPQPKVRPPKIEVWLNRKLIDITWQAGEFCSLGTRFFAGSQGVELVCQSYGEGIFRINFRALVDKVINDLRIIVYGQLNQVTVEYAAERQPCEVLSIPIGSKITLCDGIKPGVESLEELGWMLGGVIDTKLPPGSAEQYASEVDAATQYKQRGVVWRSIDFVVQPTGDDGFYGHLEQYGPPLVLERGKWSPLFDGSVETKTQVEDELARFYRQRVFQRSGWCNYGSWPNKPGCKERCRHADYHPITALHRAVVRAESPKLWDKMARVAGLYSRDCLWLKGQVSHGKGLAPWSGPYSGNGHWVDSEALLMQWLVYGDEFARRTYDQWAAAWYEPTAPGRESRVAKRMCDVAAIYLQDKKWAERAAKIQDRELARDDAGEAVTGVMWHPEWCDKTIYKDQQRPEGWINAKAFPILNSWVPQQRDKDTYALMPPNVGPLGEGGLLLQMHRLRTGERIYGSNQCSNMAAEPVSTRIFVEKKDDKPLSLTIRLGHRINGDIHPTSLRVYDPAGKLQLCAEDVRVFMHKSQDAAGFPILEGSFVAPNPDAKVTIPAPRGKWRVDLNSHALALYAPISDWNEWQEGSGFKFPAYE